LRALRCKVCGLAGRQANARAGEMRTLTFCRFPPPPVQNLQHPKHRHTARACRNRNTLRRSLPQFGDQISGSPVVLPAHPHLACHQTLHPINAFAHTSRAGRLGHTTGELSPSSMAASSSTLLYTTLHYTTLHHLGYKCQDSVPRLAYQSTGTRLSVPSHPWRENELVLT
jgi:hypothetical protein